MYLNQRLMNVANIIQGYKVITRNYHKRASLACAARLVDTVSAGGALWAPGVTLFNYKGDDIPKYVCHTAIIDIERKITKFVNF